jgi:hypothetical protein
LRNEIKELEADAKLNPLESRALTEEAQGMLKVWHGNSATNLGDLTSLFEKHVHDSMAESMLEEVYSDFVFSRHYLNYRHITLIEHEPDRNFFERQWDHVVNGAKYVTYELPKDLMRM